MQAISHLTGDLNSVTVLIVWSVFLLSSLILHSPPPPPPKTMYRKSDCEFLLDNNDTIAAYEARAVARPSSHETAMSAFSSTLDRVQQVEAIHRESATIYSNLSIYV